MRTKPVELHVGEWSHGATFLAAGIFLLALQLPSSAVDAVPLLDAPGPGYREQSARVKEPPAPAKLEPIGFMYLFMAPQPSFDGAAVDQPLLLPRGEFELLRENAGWNFRVFDAPLHPPVSSMDLPAPGAPLPNENSAGPSLERAPGPQDAIRLPVIPEVILPAPKEVDAASDPKQPFVEHLPLELRPR